MPRWRLKIRSGAGNAQILPAELRGTWIVWTFRTRAGFQLHGKDGDVPLGGSKLGMKETSG